MLFFSKNKHIAKYIILLFTIFLSGLFLNTKDIHARELAAWFWDDNTNIDGKDILESSSRSIKVRATLHVWGTDGEGYTVSINAKNDTTSLVNEEKFVNDEIKSIHENLTLDNFADNNWGFSTDGTNFQPIPDKAHPKIVAQTKGQDVSEVDTYYTVKLSENIKPANYRNIIVYSVVLNQTANLPSGIEFNKAIKEIAGGEENVVHIKASNTIPNGANVKNIATNADVKGEFKIWYDQLEKTVYYWTSTKYAYLNENSEKMFDGFSNLESIDTTKLNASFATTTANMFSKNPKLKTLNFGEYIFKTGRVINMHEMFADTGLERIPMGDTGYSLDTKNVVDMSGMFARSRKLWDLRFVGIFDFSNAEDLSYMFYGVNGSDVIFIGSFGNRIEKVKKLDYIFATDQENKVKSISTTTYSGHLTYDTWNTRSVVSYNEMFAGRTNYDGCGSWGTSVPLSDLSLLRVGSPSGGGYFCNIDTL